MEERWEAVEAAERLFEGATVGASTENVALGRVPEGTELVRIGRVNRPELAAWRYGERLIGRWKRQSRAMKLSIGAGLALGAIPIVGDLALGGFIAFGAAALFRDQRTVMRTAEGRAIRRSDADRALLAPGSTLSSWRLVVPRLTDDDIALTGDESLLALRKLMPRANFRGGHPDEVQNAVQEVERVANPRTILSLAAMELEDTSAMDNREMPWRKRPHRIATGHPVLKLAVEMAVNEETERRALEGEVSLLEREWREAEELAAIADDLLYPAALRERLRELGRD